MIAMLWRVWYHFHQPQTIVQFDRALARLWGRRKW